MDMLIKPSKLKGTISIPPSKSYSHRHLMMAMLSKKKTIVKGVNLCDDILATLNVGINLGCEVSIHHQDITIDSSMLFSKNDGIMDVYASGSTLRFFIPVCLTQPGTYRFYLRDRLIERSLKVYEELFKQCTFHTHGNILEVSGQITSGFYEIDGSHSSQFMSGLLMALPLLEGDSEVVIKEPFVSRDYFKMTLACMKSAGIKIKEIDKNHYFIDGNQKYQYQPYMIESDASAAVFIKVAKYLGHPLVCDMTPTHFQKDAMIDEFLKQIAKGNCVIDVRDCPDIVPALALGMALSPYRYTIIGAKRLIDKESNRLLAVSDVLTQLGAWIQMTEDGLMIEGGASLHGGEVDSYHDHRIAMMAVIAGFSCEKDVVLKNGECASKSWPSFYRQMKDVGGAIYEL